MTTPVMTYRWAEPESWTLATYERTEGYAALRTALTMDPDAIIATIKESGLRGRGGAGFPTGMKWGFIPQGDGKPHYLVVNADEGEPGTCKDAPLMMADPHSLIEGVIIASFAVRCHHAFIYLRGELVHAGRRLQAAIDEAYAAGYLGDNILGSGFDLKLTLHRGAGAYICGEETALLDSLEGRRGQPRPRPPFPPVQGLYNAPTQINNVCTIASVPSILELGAAEFAKIGSESSPGTAVFSISGNVVRPGNYELELGTPMRELIYDLAGGIPDGRELKAVIPGGSSVPALTPDQIDVPLDYDSLAALGTFFGAASLIVVDDRCCMVQLALRSTKFYMHESCGKCTPCREGTRWMVQLLEKIEAGDAELSDVDLLRSVCDRILGKSLCALGDFAVYPVASYMKHWADEFVAHVEHGGCPFQGESTLEGIVAPSDAHRHEVVA
jgi:NADH-quinone oxidoreductase subunit F